MYISHVNTVAKARLFTAEFSQLSIFTADCLRHPIQMAGIETIWELHTLIVMNSCYRIAGNFREVQNFAIFATHDQNAKIRTAKYETAKI